MQKNLDVSFKKDGYTGITLTVFEEYTQFFQKCNWYTFTPIHFELDWEKDMGCFSVDFVILGLGFVGTLRYKETKSVRHLRSQVEAITKGGYRFVEDLPE